MAREQTAKVERLDHRRSQARAKLPERSRFGADLWGELRRWAGDPTIALDKLEALIAADERRDLRAAQRAYAAAMTAMAAELPVITERGEITVGERVVATYALWEDINETIKGVLAKHGFALSFRTACEDQAVMVTAVLDHKGGHQEATSLRLPPDLGPERNAVQAVGSTVSYGKRYTACALLNITTKGEDDDGRQAGGRVSAEQVAAIESRLGEGRASRRRFLRYLKVEAVEQIPPCRFDEAMAALSAKTQGAGGVPMSAALILQGTPEWEQARCGRVTASRLGDVTARTKTAWGAARASYMGQLLAERLTGKPQDVFVTPAMRWGTECEDQARAAYEYWTDQDVASVGFVTHPAISMSGASPDGLVGHEGLVEIKCPTTVTHIDTLIGDEAPLKHLPQIQWQLACTGRAWCDFVCFDPRMPESLRIFIRRVERDETFIAELQTQVELFLHELDQRLWAVSQVQQLRHEREMTACCA